MDLKEPDNETNKSTLLSLIKATSCRVIVPDTTAALFWLNQGATKIILHTTTLLAEASLPKERVVLNVGNPNNADESIRTLAEFTTEFLVPFSEDLSAHMETIKKVYFI